ncbi:ImmA/IrrE family metallo-endopeptidase [Halobacillus litoralis]|uniref:ImmA/IrrE family metallo-endopeptidase n=2 Tax=Halobacillus litoralis TaxID=45668 RepID=A0A845DXC0_9BACI|nr:ImmA/IrrE family metallo-endopeptidase [Halobacillus litoralis]
MMVKKRTKSAKDKKQEIEKLTEDRNKEVEKFFESDEQMKAYLTFMSKFYNYSARNTILIQKQFLGAEAVGSFKFWKDKGFPVQKGEKGIKVLVPYKYKVFERERTNGSGTVKTPVKYATKKEKEGMTQGNIPVKEKLAYTTGHVFDVSQTSATAEDLPEIFPNKWLEGDVENYKEMVHSLKGLAEQMDVKVMDHPRGELGAAKGVYVEYQQPNRDGSYDLRKAIELNPRNSELNNVKTLIHELAHAKLHNTSTENSKTLNKNEKEFQAELTAFTVCSYFHLDTSDTSLNYLHHYTRNHQSINDKLTLMEEVKSTSYEFITHLEKDLLKERDLGYQTNETPEKADMDLQKAYGSIQVVTDGQIKKVEGLSLSEFQEVFHDEHDRNILNQPDLKGLDVPSMIQSFNNLKENWHGDKPNVKMIDPKLNDPAVYVVWSESTLDQTLMTVEDMDKQLAAANLESLKEDGYDKTKINILIPKDHEVSVHVLNRIDLGDGTYGNMYDHLEQSQTHLSKYFPADKGHLGDVYSKEEVSQAFAHIYKENLHLQHRHNRDDHQLSVSNHKVHDAENFAVTYNLLSEDDLNEIQSKVADSFQEEHQHTTLKNQMLNLKGQYERFQSLVQKENTGELTEEKIVGRMAAENQYAESKKQAIQEGYVSEESVLKMEKDITRKAQKQQVKAVDHDNPFSKEGRKTSHKSSGLTM